MKFKSIFILFNAVILLSFCFVFAMPFFALGAEFALSFWKTSWPLGLLLLIILTGFDVFFMTNVKLFELLEREDWPALVQYLEDRVLKQHRYTQRLVKLLIHSYLVMSDPQSVITLEVKLKKENPKLLRKNTLLFGLSHVLKGDHVGAVTLFLEQEKNSNHANDWEQWYLCFALLLQQKFTDAADRLIVLAQHSKDSLVCALSALFLQDTIVKAVPEKAIEAKQAAETAKQRIKRALPDLKAWNKELGKAQGEIHVIILAKSLEDAARYIYEEEPHHAHV
ncbi:hypothetical protein [Gracilinema caldarium]|uniref:HemY N-terminal domain-containing protein n=1 Tax=Gracilinema caldarium (strain ATCC 51460 / DSM 7334 / H1) TaxID=744872 RepID=F8F1M7_GRAC1|nr:hypothetical protein [Gracilinema caldarium]AEJ19361.1 hypothetical protein Spica_1215 [Gracilinema caldarium DSM 7334]